MKNLISIIVFVTLALFNGAQAESSEGKSANEICSSYSKMAENAARSRYAGVPLRKSMKRVQESTDTKAGKELFGNIVVGAYELPDYSTDSYRQQATREYGNKVHRQCLKSMNQ